MINTPHSNARDKSTLEKIEDEIVNALKQGVDGSVKVEAFPSHPDNYDFAGLKAAALVHYSASQYQANKGRVDTVQERRVNFAIVLLARELRGQGSAYTTIEDIRLALQGQVFHGAGPVEIVRDGLISEKKGRWRWEVVIGMNTPAVARPNRHGIERGGLMHPVVQSS